MQSLKPEFPYFVATAARELSAAEHDTVEKMLETASVQYTGQVAELRVVGRCGCGVCPTVFFEPYDPDTSEEALCTYVGRDKEGGLVGAILMQQRGRISQLDYYSIDGHEPWHPPVAQDLDPSD